MKMGPELFPHKTVIVSIGCENARSCLKVYNFLQSYKKKVTKRISDEKTINVTY